MRPLVPLAHAAEAAREPAGVLLLDALGTYCATCERPLPLEFWVLDVPSGTVHGPDESIADAGSALPLCHDCVSAHLRAGGGPLDEGVLLPHRALTFGLGDRSPLVYTARVGPRVSVGRQTLRVFGAVLVEPRGEEATATVDHFALNTRFYDRREDALRADDERGVRRDRRVELRSRAWIQALRCVRHLGGEAVREAGPELTEGVRDIIAATGFWSVFATVFWDAWEDEDVLEDLLSPRLPPERGHPGLRVAGEIGGIAPERFPGTDPGWLGRR